MSAVLESSTRFPGAPAVADDVLEQIRAEQNAAIEIASALFLHPLTHDMRLAMLTAYQFGRLDAIRFANVTVNRVRR